MSSRTVWTESICGFLMSHTISASSLIVSSSLLPCRNFSLAYLCIILS